MTNKPDPCGVFNNGLLFLSYDLLLDFFLNI
jgi:hypothetical protein